MRAEDAQLRDTNRPPESRLPRCYAILARSARVGVVFRRGPSKLVQLLLWDLAEDRLEPGQRFKGRIYERRCDLSPRGDKLIYFAAKYRGPYKTWTAVSTPPYLTALLLWPNGGAWGGGGLFASEKHILLNHRAEGMRLAEGYRYPARVRVKPLGERPGLGEDEPIHGARLLRDGWRLESPGEEHRDHRYHSLRAEGSRPRTWIRVDPARVYAKPRGGGAPSGVELRMSLNGIHERDGPWYVLEYSVRDPGTGEERSLGRLDWADWDQNGDLLCAREGRLFRLHPADWRNGLASAFDPSLEAEVADLRGATFENRSAPPEALDW